MVFVDEKGNLMHGIVRKNKLTDLKMWLVVYTEMVICKALIQTGKKGHPHCYKIVQVLNIQITLRSIPDLQFNNISARYGIYSTDINNLKWRGQIIETVVMNPPFGTRRKGANMDFLFSAMKTLILIQSMGHLQWRDQVSIEAKLLHQ